MRRMQVPTAKVLFGYLHVRAILSSGEHPAVRVRAPCVWRWQRRKHAQHHKAKVAGVGGEDVGIPGRGTCEGPCAWVRGPHTGVGRESPQGERGPCQGPNGAGPIHGPGVCEKAES